jgi:hypothetical protein
MREPLKKKQSFCRKGIIRGAGNIYWSILVVVVVVSESRCDWGLGWVLVACQALQSH